MELKISNQVLKKKSPKICQQNKKNYKYFDKEFLICNFFTIILDKIEKCYKEFWDKKVKVI